MTPEPTLPLSDAPAIGPPQDDPIDGVARDVALQTGNLQIKMFAHYLFELRGLEKEAGESTRDFKRKFKFLSDFNAFAVLFCIFQFSEPGGGLRCASSVTRADHGKPQSVTRYRLAKALAEELPLLDSDEARRVHVSRIIDLAIVLGLVVESELNGRKPLQATDRLFSLMTRANTKSAVLMRDAVANRIE